MAEKGWAETVAKGVERSSVGLTTFSGVLAVAFISGIPSATCRAMALSYYESSIIFGGSAGLSLLAAIYCLAPLPRMHPFAVNQVRVYAPLAALAISLIFFCAGVWVCSGDLRTAIDLCLPAAKHR